MALIGESKAGKTRCVAEVLHMRVPHAVVFAPHRRPEVLREVVGNRRFRSPKHWSVLWLDDLEDFLDLTGERGVDDELLDGLLALVAHRFGSAIDRQGTEYLGCLTQADSNSKASQPVSAVVVAHSVDHGATFSTPSIVTTSYCAHSSPTGRCIQGAIVDQEAMAAGAAGQVYVCWTEFRSYPGRPDLRSSTYVAHSTNSTATR